MKQFYLIVCIALLINTQTQAQTTHETIYFWKGGQLVIKQSIKAADLDSITFKRPTVLIGTQTWETINLDVTTYSDGTPIPQVTDPTQWGNLTTGAWCYYNNDSATGTTYDKLYNWYAVAGIHDTDLNTPNKKLAPTGYHIPSDAEWTNLTTYLDLGGESIAGGKMKATGTSLWNFPNKDATNSSGFTGLPGGYRGGNGSFDGIGGGGGWWSSSEGGTTLAWLRTLNYGSGGAYRDSGNKRNGFSVRCLVGEPAVVAVAPTITTTAVSSIGTTAASSGGVITADGGASVTERGLVWSTATNPTIALSTKTQNGTGTGTYTSALSGLIANTTYYVRAYATNSAGTGYGAQLSFATLPPTEVVIGTQTWETINLDVATYSDGTVIPQVTDPTAWASLTTGAWCYYNNDSARGTTYGKLYNWYAAAGIHDNDPNTPNKKLAPTGYHVPSDAEWTTLIDYLGGGEVAGGKMKATGTSLWNTPNAEATNSSGFTGLPGGFRYNYGSFTNIGNFGYWWSSSEDSTTNAWFRFLYYDGGGANRFSSSKKNGFSVRCLVGEPAVVAVAPTIIGMLAVSSIGTTTASSGGAITADGGAAISARGVVWSTSTNPTIALSTKTEDGTGTGTYTSALSGLIGNTTYYVRAYATNSAGTGYGAEVSFATLIPTEVVIGTQTWETINLDVTTYSDGTVIPQVTDPTAWANLTTGAWCYYNNDSATGTTYGKLYNWYAVAGIHDTDPNTPNKKLAPSGYHIPSDAEWTTLTTYLGGEEVAGGKMKETGTSLWNFPNQDATNSSGFSGLPGGNRVYDGCCFETIGYGGFWWSSSEDGTTNAWSRYLDYYGGFALSFNYNKLSGFSVRCLRD